MGTRERREREKQQRRRDIVDAARRVFWDRGYDGATMPQVAEVAELAPGTLYLYFPSKDSLYAELLIEGYDLLISRFEGRISRALSAREQAEGLISVLLDFARESPEYFDVIFFVAQRCGKSVCEVPLPDEQAKRLAEREEACKLMAADILRGVRGGAADAELRVTVDAVWSMLVGVVFYFFRDGREVFDSVAEHAKAMILRGLFGDSGG